MIGGEIVKLSVLQPCIERGNITKNTTIIQRLINNASGNLLLLAEYALTGSLVLEKNVDVHKWVDECELAKNSLSIPDGKKLLINSLIIKDKKIYNACTMLPSEEIVQIKTYLDVMELDAGICPGNEVSILQINERKIVIVICTDLRVIDKISTTEADFIIFIFHFTLNNYGNVMDELITISKARRIPIIAVSLVSDKNYGHSCYINGSTVVSLGDEEGILEITI